MKRFVLQVLFFLVFASVTYAAWVFLWQNTGYKRFKGNINYRLGTYGNMFTRVREIPDFENIDLLFLGSSHTYRGFDVRIFEEAGYHSFNLGSSSQTPIQTKTLLLRYLDHFNPKLVVYEVYPNTFCVDGVEASTDVIANDVNDFHSFEMVWATKNAKVFNTLVYGGVRDVFNLNANFVEPINKPQSVDYYVHGGYVEKELRYYSSKTSEGFRWAVNDLQVQKFQEVLAILETKSIPVVFVFNPVTQELYKSYEGKDEFESWIKPYGEYYNMNTLVNLDDSLHFYDNNHMNQNGVTMANQKLIEVLKNNGY